MRMLAGEGGGAKIDKQPYEPRGRRRPIGQYARGTSLPCKDKGRGAVSMPRHSRSQAVPHPWRAQHWRAARRGERQLR
jgi:hypothetical protein